MGNEKNDASKSRRWFLSLLSGSKTSTANTEKVKMLTADGKLVEIDRSVLDAASTKQPSSNQEIYHWMENPSKEKK